MRKFTPSARIVSRTFAIALLPIALAACMVGPDHVRPTLAVPGQFVSIGSSKAFQKSASGSGWGATVTGLASLRTNCPGTDRVGRTWSGPTMQEARAIGSSALARSKRVRAIRRS